MGKIHYPNLDKLHIYPTWTGLLCLVHVSKHSFVSRDLFTIKHNFCLVCKKTMKEGSMTPVYTYSTYLHCVADIYAHQFFVGNCCYHIKWVLSMPILSFEFLLGICEFLNCELVNSNFVNSDLFLNKTLGIDLHEHWINWC